ncbi:hypothetical protein MVEG_06321 [Podila verticillata NRRL 6337]|nr:MAG: hypothetical protein BYD32DRAFT_415254 [Podila humilis]KFH67589.1 hypothetical protein MVEG_06321 [Podila verticillata NRRL 6337]
MLRSTSKTVRAAGFALAGLLVILLLRSILHRSSSSRHTSKHRTGQPKVIVLVHPSPALDKTANFHLKRAIARTWAKDTDDFGVTVYFVGEHKGEVVMRQPSYLLRSGSGSVIYSSNNNNQNSNNNNNNNNNNNANSNSGRSGKEEHLRKMLIPLVVENGKADDAPGLLKSYHFLYNNTDWQAGPLLSVYPYVLNTDTTHYIHIENLASTLSASKHRRLLTMKDDTSFTGTISEASECNPEQYGDDISVESISKENQTKGAATPLGTPSQPHWTSSKTHLVSRQLLSIIGPHLEECIKGSSTASLLLSNSPLASSPTASNPEEALQKCVREWASHPLFWKDAYCGRWAALRYQSPALDPQSSTSSENRRMTSPRDFESFYRDKQQERMAAQEERDKLSKGDEEEQRKEEEAQKRKAAAAAAAAADNSHNKQYSTSARWVVASGLRQPEDFLTMHQNLADGRNRDERTRDFEY